MTILSPDYVLELARKHEAEGKYNDGRVLVRRGRRTLALHSTTGS